MPFLQMGDFNVEPTEQPMENFSLIYNCKSIFRDHLRAWKRTWKTQSALRQ